MSRRERLIRWLAVALPEPVAAAPERVLINLLCVLVGVSVVVSGGHGSPLWPRHVGLAWAATMIFGGIAALVGYWAGVAAVRPWSTSLARVGYFALLLATAIYGVRLLWAVELTWQTAVYAAIFLGIAAAKAVRLLVSTAARDEVLRAGEDRR